MSKRISFVVDEDLEKFINEVKDLGGFSSLSDLIRSSISINKALINATKKGYTEVVLQNPKSKEREFLFVPYMSKVHEKIKKDLEWRY